MSGAPLRLALVRQRYTASGGAERFLARALDALQARGVTLTLITRRWQRASDVRILHCNPFYLGNVWRDWSFARCACDRLARADVDLVQSHERIACCDIYRAGDGVHREWLAQRRRVLRGWRRIGLALNLYHYYVQHAEAVLFGGARLRAVICNSHMVRQEIEHHFGVPRSKLHVIYSGIDTAAFHPDVRQRRAAMRATLGIADDVPLFLFVGSGFERKGLAAALEALSRVPAAQLLVVGKDKRQANYRTLARQLRLGKRVHFLGSRADVIPYYGASDALILPTLYDPFPNVALEAMACGLPIITSTKSGAAELIESGRNGFVCDALDIGAIAQALTALTAAGACTRMGAAARDTVAPFTLDAMSRNLGMLYDTLLRNPA